MIKAAILDDEIKGSTLLQHKLQDFSDTIEINAIFNDPIQALENIKSLSIDVLFLDIEMPKLNGFQFLEQLGSFDFEVIFVTAYNAYVLDALRKDALDYLMKPVDFDELKSAINKLKDKLARKTAIPKANYKDNKKISLPTAEGIYFVKKEDIIMVEAMSNYSIFHLLASPKIIVSKTLKEYETLLNDIFFLRVNRSTILNLNYVVKYRKGDGGTLELMNGHEVEVSPSKKSLVLERLL